MGVEQADLKDLFDSVHERLKTSLSPRIIIIDNNANIPLVRYKDTPWFGLPGGKVKEKEAVEDANFLSTGAYPTLIREVKEECRIDISDSLRVASCLGVAEIGIVDSVKRVVNYSLSPIFVCRREGLSDVNNDTQLFNLRSYLPGPIFPDARLAIRVLKDSIRTKKGPIQPAWLNDGRVIYFEMKPQMRLLMEPPNWL